MALGCPGAAVPAELRPLMTPQQIASGTADDRAPPAFGLTRSHVSLKVRWGPPRWAVRWVCPVQGPAGLWPWGVVRLRAR